MIIMVLSTFQLLGDVIMFKIATMLFSNDLKDRSLIVYVSIQAHAIKYVLVLLCLVGNDLLEVFYLLGNCHIPIIVNLSFVFICLAVENVTNAVVVEGTLFVPLGGV